MTRKIPYIGILQGRLTPSPDGNIQFFPHDNWRNEFDIARDIGFDCMEWLVRQDSLKENPLISVGPLTICALAVDSCMPVLSVHGFYSKLDDFPAILRDLIWQAFSLEAETVLVPFFNNNKLVRDQDKALARQQLFLAVIDCQLNGMVLGIEAEMPAPELIEFVKSFNLPNIGVYYDIGNMASMGVDVAQEIRILGNLICGVHVKDRLAGGGTTVPLGDGCADFEAAFMALRDVGYGGPFIIQGARVPGVDDVELNTRYYYFCKNLLEKTYGGGGQ